MLQWFGLGQLCAKIEWRADTYHKNNHFKNHMISCVVWVDVTCGSLNIPHKSGNFEGRRWFPNTNLLSCLKLYAVVRKIKICITSFIMT